MPLAPFPCPACHAHPRRVPCGLCSGAGEIADVQLSRHFRLSELLRSDVALRRDFTNNPTPAQIESITRLCTSLLDPVADHFGGLRISSGFRSPAVNLAIGGSLTSSHCAPGQAAAADTEPVDPRVRLPEIIAFVRESGLAFDQVIYEYGAWVHLSDRNKDGEQRGQVLMKFQGSGYQPYDASDPRVK